MDRKLLAARVVAAALVLAGGIVHFKLWNDDVYPDDVATSFLLNAIGSAAAAVALVVLPHWLPVVGALAITNGTLIAFGLSRTGDGIPVLDFAERGWNPSPEAALALGFELAAAVVLLVALWLSLGPGSATQRDQPRSWD